MKIDASIDAFVIYIRTERRLSALTVTAYSEDLNMFASFLDAQFKINNVEDITHIEVREWQLSLMEQGQNANSVKRRLTALRTWFRFMRRQGWVTVDVMAKVKAPKGAKRLPVFFTEKDVSKVYDSMYFEDTFEGQRDQLLLRLLYETGMRRAEVLALTEGSVDFDSGTIKVLGKRDKERIIPIENELLHNIKCYFTLKKEKESASKAFFVRDDGTPFTQYDVSKVVKRYMSMFSNADRISPHVFRHSFATHLLNEGADITAIKELLGHTDLAATEVYTHVTREHLKEAYKHAHPREKKIKRQ